MFPFQPLLQLLQSQVRLTTHLSLHPLPDRSRNTAWRTVTPCADLDLAGLAPARRQLLRPILTDPKTLRQFLQTSFPTVIRLEELPSQIVRVWFRHLGVRKIATLSLLHK
jgi:hypothetical protein